MVKISCVILQSIIKNFNLPDTTSKPISGRSTKLNARDVRTVIRTVIRNVQNNSKIFVPKLTQHIVKTTGKNCRTETLRMILRKDGSHDRVARRKPLIIRVNQ